MSAQILFFPNTKTARQAAELWSASLEDATIEIVSHAQTWLQFSWRGGDVASLIVALAGDPQLRQSLRKTWPILSRVETTDEQWDGAPLGIPLTSVSGIPRKLPTKQPRQVSGKKSGASSQAGVNPDILYDLPFNQRFDDSTERNYLTGETDAVPSDETHTPRPSQTKTVAEEKTVVVERQLEGRFPQNIKIGQSVAMEVRITEKRDATANNSTASLLDFALPARGGDVKLALHAPGFEAADGAALIQTVRVPQRGDSDPVAFELKATQLGKQELEVTAYFGGSYLGALQIEVHINERATGEGRVWTQPTSIRAGTKGDITLQIRRMQDFYEFQVFGGWPMQPLRSPLFARTPEAEVETLLSALDNQARGGNPFSSPALTRRWLSQQGARLWDAFVPQQLQEFFWENADNLRRVTVISEGDVVPWELLYPSGQGNSDQTFLIERVGFARWTYGDAPPSTLKWGATAFVQPDSNLQLAAKEVENLSQIIPGAAGVEPTRDLTALLEHLDRGDFDVLHFACHNRFVREAAASSYIEMNGRERFDPSFLGNKSRWKQAGPLIFLNACRGAGQGLSYTKAAGWASAFLERGAGAFLSSLWEVRDDSAPDFAAAFYGSLRQGNTCAQALTHARNAISCKAGDPTWLAYAFYGDPDATFEPSASTEQTP